jgi:DNA-binding GntR family transcriptional regulator
MTDVSETAANRAKFQPQYGQAKDLIVNRIGPGEWQAGKMIPDEFQPAGEINVSQGNVHQAKLFQISMARAIQSTPGR